MLALVGVDQDRIVGGVGDDGEQVVELVVVVGCSGEVERHVKKCNLPRLALDPAVVFPAVGFVADVDDGAELQALEKRVVDALRMAAAVEIALDDPEVERWEVAGLAGKDLERRVVAVRPGGSSQDVVAVVAVVVGAGRRAVAQRLLLLLDHGPGRRGKLHELELRVEQLVLVRLRATDPIEAHSADTRRAEPAAAAAAVAAAAVHAVPLPVLVPSELLEYLLTLCRHSVLAPRPDQGSLASPCQYVGLPCTGPDAIFMSAFTWFPFQERPEKQNWMSRALRRSTAPRRLEIQLSGPLGRQS